MDACVRFQAARRQLDTIQLLLKDEIRHMDIVESRAKHLVESEGLEKSSGRKITKSVKHPYMVFLTSALPQSRVALLPELSEKIRALDLEMRSGQEQVTILQLLEEHEIRTMEESISTLPQASQAGSPARMRGPSPAPVVAEPYKKGTSVNANVTDLVSPQQHHVLPTVFLVPSLRTNLASCIESKPSLVDASVHCTLISEEMYEDVTKHMREDMAVLQKDLCASTAQVTSLKQSDEGLANEKTVLTERIVGLEDELHDERVCVRETTAKCEHLHAQLMEWQRRYEELVGAKAQVTEEAKRAANDGASERAKLQARVDSLTLALAQSDDEKARQMNVTKVLSEARSFDEQTIKAIKDRIPKLESENDKLRADLAAANRNVELLTALRTRQSQEYEELKELHRSDSSRYEKDLLASHNALLAREEEVRTLRRTMMTMSVPTTPRPSPGQTAPSPVSAPATLRSPFQLKTK
jgi:hypothetical protein